MSSAPPNPIGLLTQQIIAVNVNDDHRFVSDTIISPYSAMNVPAYRRAIAFLAENLASFPRSVHREGAPVAKTEPHPLAPILKRRPNDYQNPFTLWRTWFANAAHRGNGYLRIERRAGAPVGLHNLLPEDVKPLRFWAEGATTPEQLYMYAPTKEVLFGADVLHLQNLGYDGMEGDDTTTRHAATFRLAHTLGKFQTKLLQKGTIIRGSVEVPADMDDEQIEALASKIRTHFTGIESDRDVIILPGGAKLSSTSISPEKSFLKENNAEVTKQISQATGVPPEFLMEFSESKYNNNLEQMGQNVVRYTFRPWIEQAEDELSLKLLTVAELDAGHTIRINPDALLRGDTKAVNDSAKTTVDAGLRTKNEGRELLGLPRVEDPEADKLQTLGSTTPTTSPALST